MAGTIGLGAPGVSSPDTPAFSQQPAIIFEVVSKADTVSFRDRAKRPDSLLRWENLKFVFAGPDQITREEVSEAQVTVFDLESRRIVFQTDVYQISGEELRPGPNHTAFFHLLLEGVDGESYDVMVASGRVELVVPLGPPKQLSRVPRE